MNLFDLLPAVYRNVVVNWFAGLNTVVAPRTTTTAEQSRPTSIAMNVVKLLAIVIVTVAVTLLCIRSGQAMAKAPVTVPVHAVYQTPAPLTTTAATAPETVTDPTPNATASADWTDAERAVEPVQAASRSLDGGGGGSPVGLPAARMAGTVPAAVVRGKFVTRQQPLGAAYHPDFTARGDVDDADEDDGDDNPSRPANIIVDAGVYNVHRYTLNYILCNNNGVKIIQLLFE